MASRYYEIRRRKSLQKLEEVKSEKRSLEALIENRSKLDQDVQSKLEEVDKLISDSEGLHEKYDFMESFNRSKRALKLLKELDYLVLASRK